MYIAKRYFETYSNEQFQKGAEVPAEIAKKFKSHVQEIDTKSTITETIEDKVEDVKEELLIDESSKVQTDVQETEEKTGILGKLLGK